MKVDVEPGKYIIAVSGGVDSVVLLNVLQSLPDAELVVAHFDHGIRKDSANDKEFVQSLAESYTLSFVYDEGRLGVSASEETAREARYRFLRKARDDHNAQAIITAHHQDDVLETAIINLLRGTGRKGLNSLGSHDDVIRPLLHVPKQDIVAYAKTHSLQWREDSTNQDQAYLRNYIRHRILSNFDEHSRTKLVDIINKSITTNQELDTLLAKQLQIQSGIGHIDRQWFNRLPHDVAREVMAAWLRANDVRSFDTKSLERLVVAAKVGRPGSQFDILRGRALKVTSNDLALTLTER